MRGQVSNLEYLLRLNEAAGRCMIDALFHPIVPWVSDGTERDESLTALLIWTRRKCEMSGLMDREVADAGCAMLLVVMAGE